MSTADSLQPSEAVTPDEADRASVNAAFALGLTLPGDTVLYLLLPLYAAEFGVSLPEAGVLLAANRLVRIIGYEWVARFYSERGARAACLVATFGAIAATVMYATASGLWLLLIARLIWGMSFAALNIANQALPTAEMKGAAKRAGRTRSIVAVGPMLGLVVSALMAVQFGPRSAFVLLAVVALAAPLMAARIPRLAEKPALGGPRFEWPGPISLWSFAMGFTLDGLFIFGLGLLAAANYPKGAVLAAGIAMALRYAVEVAFSPVGGHLAHHFGARLVVVLSSLGAALGLALIPTEHLLWFGVAFVIVLRALVQALTAPMVAEAHPGAERVRALARQATWRDIGAGTGPLAAGLLFPVLAPIAIYGGASMLLAATSLMLIGLRRPATAAEAAIMQPPRSGRSDGG